VPRRLLWGFSNRNYMLTVEMHELKMVLGRILKAGERLLLVTSLSPLLRVKTIRETLDGFS
jgi:hypothetical protein